jgi:hypothetical protein
MEPPSPIMLVNIAQFAKILLGRLRYKKKKVRRGCPGQARA